MRIRNLLQRRITTGATIMRERGVKADPDGAVSGAEFVRVNLPMVIACTDCEMTLTFPGAVVDRRSGHCYCRSCGAELRWAVSWRAAIRRAWVRRWRLRLMWCSTSAWIWLTPARTRVDLFWLQLWRLSVSAHRPEPYARRRWR